MPAEVQEWLNLFVRWIHVVAAIMWVGDSFLFMWMDSHLSKPLKAREGDVVGELWMTHSGGFYEVVKRKTLAKGEMPPNLYWFKWESYTTFLSGFFLLVIVYHLNGAALLVDPRAPHAVSAGMAAHLSILSLPLAYVLYELLWKTPLSKSPRVFAVVGLGLIVAMAYGFLQVFSARGAFLQTGAVMGSVMAANVFFRIIPSQKAMLAATRAGEKVDATLGLRAKGRSIQNHYLTLPVLFTMLSNHFPSTYGSQRPWLVLACLVVFGAGLKYVMNFRLSTSRPVLVGTVGAFVGAVVFAWPVSQVEAARAAYAQLPNVSFGAVNDIVQARCVSCHAAHPPNPLFAAPPMGVTLDTPEAVVAHADRIFARTVLTQTMPLQNMTGMTDEERNLVGAWYMHGANGRAVGVERLSAPSAPVKKAPVSQDGPSSIEAPKFDVQVTDALVKAGKTAFTNKGCSVCHRIGGGSFVGPDLKGVTARRTPTWIKRMILRPDVMIVEDPVAKALYEERKTAMPNQHVDAETDLPALLAFLKSEEK